MKLFRLILITTIAFLFFMHYKKSVSGSIRRSDVTNKTFISPSVKSKLMSGDLILRSGRSFISDVFRQFSLNDKKYSHAGIISIEKDKIFVYHILGGEAGQKNQLRKENLDSFCNEKDNSAFSVYRYDLSKAEKKNMLNILQSLYSKKIFFDSQFDLTTDSAMYCTELVYKVIEKVCPGKKYLSHTIIEGKKYIAPDNLYLNPHTTLIYSWSH